MVGGALTRASVFRVGLGVGRTFIVSGSRTRPSHSCDGWVCDLGVVSAPLIFGLTRRSGAFAGGLLTFALVSGFQLAQHNRGKCHFFSASFPSQLDVMVGDALARTSALHEKPQTNNVKKKWLVMPKKTQEKPHYFCVFFGITSYFFLVPITVFFGTQVRGSSEIT